MACAKLDDFSLSEWESKWNTVHTYHFGENIKQLILTETVCFANFCLSVFGECATKAQGHLPSYFFSFSFIRFCFCLLSIHGDVVVLFNAMKWLSVIPAILMDLSQVATFNANRFRLIDFVYFRYLCSPRQKKTFGSLPSLILLETISRFGDYWLCL